ncbi:methyltransferase [Arcanobacterium buesumense]|uniref:Methyltransferase n=1 Tax=Arcanobacterium buesumense TaxID=2722751 RepID=A0A6H2ENL3_9ACTO|nr:methyltransferase [Arcanobacterium buesumense]QJC22668.1 methyltransferase [Arcanobacterium buesumense]
MNDHYFSDSPHVPSDPRTYSYWALGREWHVTTDAGVFSPTGLDKGTAVFLHKVPLIDLPAQSLAVDVGCGWGPITLALAHSYPQAQVLACDVNERAIALTEQNVAELGYTNVCVDLAPKMLDQIAADITAGKHTGIDLLWSNPPIRIGKKALHELLMQWLGLLSPNGVAFFVVQKNLGADSLAVWLNSQGYITEKIGSAKGFRVLRTHQKQN